IIVPFRLHLFPPRLTSPAPPPRDFLRHRHTPAAPCPGRQTLRNLRRGFGFFHLAEVLDLPQRNVKTEANRVIGLQGHISIVSGKSAKNRWLHAAFRICTGSSI